MKYSHVALGLTLILATAALSATAELVATETAPPNFRVRCMNIDGGSPQTFFESDQVATIGHNSRDGKTEITLTMTNGAKEIIDLSQSTASACIFDRKN